MELPKERRSPAVRILGVAGLIVVAAAVGLWAGLQVRDWRTMRAARAMAVPEDLVLAPGTEFPEVTLVDSAGSRVGSRSLLAGHGGVVLFLAPGCPACGEASARWQQMLDRGALGGVEVIAVISRPPEAIDPYRSELGAGFPMWSDPGQVFVHDYGVTAVPLVVVVDRTGAVRWAGFDFARLEAREVRALLG
jgi:peroxiredoxin